MGWWADFSQAPPGAAALKTAGCDGVLRYIGLGSEGKQIHNAEYRDYVRNGVAVLLVAEAGTGDAWPAGDPFSVGAERARIALADARAEGIPDDVGIAWAADAHATSAQVQKAIQYARGFESVLGDRTGSYGFMEVLRPVHDLGIGSWYWLAGSMPSAADQSWVNFWQRNYGTVTVNRTVCDVNVPYAELRGTTVGAVTEESASYADLVKRVAWLSDTLIEGKKTDSQINKDLAFVLDELGTKMEALSAKVAALQTPTVTLTDTQLASLASQISQQLTPGASAADVQAAVKTGLAGTVFTTRAETA